MVRTQRSLISARSASNPLLPFQTNGRSTAPGLHIFNFFRDSHGQILFSSSRRRYTRLGNFVHFVLISQSFPSWMNKRTLHYSLTLNSFIPSLFFSHFRRGGITAPCNISSSECFISLLTFLKQVNHPPSM